MSLQTINLGTTPGDGTGDPARTAFGKVNSAIAYLAGALHCIDAVADYNASGLKAQTTGSVANGSTGLTVADASTFKVGQGIFILGAGASGANLVSAVSAISGNAITLATAAGTAVTSARVQHDDTAAINAARLAAYNTGGGVVFLRKTGCDGYYRCNAPFQTATNSIIGIPPTFNTNGIYPAVQTRGEVRGSTNSAGTAYYGCVIDAMDCPAGTGTIPSVLGDAPFVPLTVSNYAANLASIESDVDNLVLVVRANSGVSGINFANSARAEVGDNMVVLSLSPTAGVVQPTTSSYGALMPQTLNNVLSRLGGYFVGWTVAARVSELCELRSPYLNLCGTGMSLYGSDYGTAGYGSHWITGQARIQNCNRVCNVENAVNVKLDLSVELAQAGSWYSPNTDGTAGWNDPSNLARGLVAYCSFNFSSTVTAPSSPLAVNGGAGVVFTDIRAATTAAPAVPAATAKYNLSDLTDSANGTYPLTNNGMVTFAAGHIGNCAVFSGSNSLSSSALNVSTGSFSVAFWCKFGTTEQKYLLTQFDTVSANNRWQIYQSSADNSVNFQPIIVNASTTQAPVVSTGALTTGAWHFVVASWNASTKVSQISVDGAAPVVAGAAAQGIQQSGTAAIFAIGAAGNNTLGTTASIDSVRVFTSVLSSAAITALYNGGAGTES